MAASTSRSARPGPRHELAEILRVHAEAYGATHAVRPDQWKVIRAIIACRTAALGGHMDRCVDCGAEEGPSYNSCRNRHCPKCQSSSQIAWVKERTKHLLPVGYFHCVFTLPSALRVVAHRNAALVYDLLFRSVAETLLTLGQDPKRYGALLGVTAVLHTWTRDLQYHPHVHCVVTGGGLSLDGTQWKGAPLGFLFPVKVMGALFAGKFIAGLTKAYETGRLTLPTESRSPGQFDALVRSLHAKSWVVYAKRPFAGAEQVLAYLGQYTHRVGLSNHRLLDVTDERVTLATRDGKAASMTPTEFISRFLRHILPPGFMKIRHYGLWAAGNRARLARALELLGAVAPIRAKPDPVPEVEGPIDLACCRNCGSRRIERRRLLPVRSSPNVARISAWVTPGPSG